MIDKRKIKDGTTKPFENGDKVLFIPEHLLLGDKENMLDYKNLGIVTGKNDTYVFVKYRGELRSQATSPKDLYFLHNRPDLEELL